MPRRGGGASVGRSAPRTSFGALRRRGVRLISLQKAEGGDFAPAHDAPIPYMQRIRGASIYPAVQNIILACRALGLGTVLTTNHIRCEAEVKALRDQVEELVHKVRC